MRLLCSIGMKRLETEQRNGGRAVLSLRDETRTERGSPWMESLIASSQREKWGKGATSVCVKTLDGSGWKHNAQMRCSLMSSGSQGCAQEFSLCLSPCVCLRQCKREWS